MDSLNFLEFIEILACEWHKICIGSVFLKRIFFKEDAFDVGNGRVILNKDVENTKECADMSSENLR